MLKSLITYGLSVLLVSGVLHVDFDDHNHIDGYSICDIGCDDEKHHSSLHQCEQCLNKNSRIITEKFCELSFQTYGKNLLLDYNSFHKKVLQLNLYSRPPPNLF